MKNIFAPALMLLCAATLFLIASPALAATPAGYPPAHGGLESPPPLPIDYISPDAVELTPQEKKALDLSGQWSRRNVDPVLAAGGKVIYVHGASEPTVVAAPYQVCDLELEQGEVVNEYVVGDSARWHVEAGVSGSGATATVHLFIKAVDAGLQTSLVITTDRRAYHVKLVSKRNGHTPYVAFAYNDAIRKRVTQDNAQADKTRHWDSTVVEGQTRELANLNFAYDVKGSRVSWRPERVYDDKRKCYIQLPKDAGVTPVLLVRKGSQDMIVNYRTQDGTIIVDGVFDRYTLILGVGDSQEKVEVIRLGVKS